jgi:methyl-accepting chemotaxis protein
MSWFNNLTTRIKLFVGFGLVIILLGVVIGIAYLGITGISDSEQKLFEKDFAIVTNLLELRADINRQRADVEQMLLTDNRLEQQRIEKDIKDRSSEGLASMQELRDLSQSDHNFLRRLDEIEGIRKEYGQARDTQIAMIYEGKIEEAKSMGLSIQAERYEKIRTLELGLGNDATERARVAVADSVREARNSIRLFGIAGLVALALAIAMIIILNRTLSNPLKEISRAAEQIAAGDLSKNVSLDRRRDEVGLLARIFDRMSENLRAQISGMIEGANVLGAAASEIVVATTQLASTAAQSATAVSETTTTVEEVRQTAEVTNQKARYVFDTAQKTVQISAGGRKAAADVAAGMNRLRQQMEAIAESMVSLSEQSQAIGQIIATVEDLAAQSNLLAVNAAIEAAKAGEHGKGFGVVAQEVKSLAAQSRQATNQVRTILSDIQRATTAAVMATEQGTKAVEAHETQTSSAAESIQSLSGSVSEAAQAATQIAASSQQQLVGMGQVATAMESIKQASTQNVASARQLESAARNVDELGHRLKQMVAGYKV